MQKTQVAIVGASGYSGQELVRLLLGHPHVAISCFTSRQYAGKPVTDIFPKFRGLVDAAFVEPKIADIVASGAQAAFLALPHGVAAEYAVPLLEQGIKVLDLSADFRLKSAAVYKDFYEHDHPAPALLARAVYGLPELHRDAIKKADLIACAGCYPTSIILGVWPVLKQAKNIIVSSMSGVSGAGRKVSEEYIFPECNESARAYGIPKHRHLSEIEEQLGQTISFTPHLIPINRGIVSTIYIDAAVPDPLPVYREFYQNERFVRVTDALPDTKNVAMTNFCDISARFDKRTKRLVVVTAIDNLTKGAAGQAVQCLNLAFGYDETEGLL
ncbi:MAG: N-acetyl-gamma-glutamyl-phosphate reductase [Verrucomicrobia bacterium]|nr:N-acetyl-gamma-glutamyl-phosphate reductase [Verrucomicrobiota bacterium]